MKYKLISANEVYIPHHGLKTTAVYKAEVENVSVFTQHVTVWHRHAPVELEADLVQVKLDVPHVWMGNDGCIMLTATGHPMITQNETLFCPKTKEGLYIRGYSPQEQKARLMTRLLPCKWARPEEA